MHTSSHYSLTLTHCETKILSAIKVILHSQDPEGESEYFPMANSHITSVCLHDCDHVHHHGYDHGHHHDYDHVLHGHGHHRDYDRDHRLLGLASDTDCSPLNKKRIELNTTTKKWNRQTWRLQEKILAHGLWIEAHRNRCNWRP